MEFLRDLWLGKYSLAKVFWVYNILVGLIAGIFLVPILKIIYNSAQSDSFQIVLAIVFLRSISIYGLVVAVGVWRSSNAYKGHLIWSLLAKVHAVLSLILIISSIIVSVESIPDIVFCASLLLATMFIINTEEDKNVLSEKNEFVKSYDKPADQDMPKSEPHNFSVKAADLNLNDLKGSEDWDLAIKYDPAIKQAFTDIYKISPSSAKSFKDAVSKNKAFNNYGEIKEKFLKEALGLNSNRDYYFNNELLNEISELLLSQNSLAAAEFIKLVSIYNLEANANTAEGMAKVFEWLKRVEDGFKIRVRDKLILAKDRLPDSNGFQIKNNLYEKFEDLGHVCYLLSNGNCAIVRPSEYRVYNSKKSARSALTHYTDYSEWTFMNLVESLHISGVPKDNATSYARNASKEKNSTKKNGRTLKQIFVDVLIKSEFAITTTASLINWGLFIFFASMIIITIFYEFGIFPAFIGFVIICGLTGGYYIFKGHNK
jgi:hypothetical protein